MAGSLQEAYELLLKSRQSRILAGGMWLRLGSTPISHAIDLSRLGLDTIQKTEDCLEIGAMVTLRQLECDVLTRAAFSGILPTSVQSIVGTQFRSTATLGGSVYARFGFSDPVCALLSLRARVVFYKAGEMDLETYLASPPVRDILTCVRIPLSSQAASYQSLRHTRTDFPVLNLSLSRDEQGLHTLSVGARPMKAMRCREAESCLDCGDTEGALQAVRRLPYGTNMRAVAGYRQEMASVLLERALEEMKA